MRSLLRRFRDRLLKGRNRRRPEQLLEGFQDAIQVRFNDVSRLTQALTHRSYVGEDGTSAILSNERMEFLGDSVLELVVNEFLYRRYPRDQEGDLTKKRSLLVSRSILAAKAIAMRLGQYLFMSDAERDSGGSTRESILADAYEAVVGAIYLDQGMDSARRFVMMSLLSNAEAILTDLENRNFKSILQEYIQSSSRHHPRYRVRSESGPDHEKTFVVEVCFRGEVLGSGEGRSKKEAEQNAARDALQRLDTLEAEPLSEESE